MIADPAARADGKCYMCLGKRPAPAAKVGDPFCSQPCCRDYHGVTWRSEELAEEEAA